MRWDWPLSLKAHHTRGKVEYVLMETNTFHGTEILSWNICNDIKQSGLLTKKNKGKTSKLQHIN